ncbi:MAG: O-antigen ligase family protein [Nitrospinota bacterium]|nr:O-antigen ligase family protein [Nitrospinota bacterium]
MKILSGIEVDHGVFAPTNGVNGHNGRPVANPEPKNQVDKWTRAGWLFIFLFVVTGMFSISVAQISISLAGVCWIGRWQAAGLGDWRNAPSFSPLAVPLLLFVALSLIAAVFSMDMSESLMDSKDLSHLLVFLVVFDFARRDVSKIPSLLRAVVAAGAGISLVGVYQAVQRGVSTADRISGFNDIYMTFAGLLMLAFVAGLAVVAFDTKKWKDAWLIPALALIACAVLLSLTRNAWIGLSAGAFVVLALRKPLLVVILPVLMVGALMVSPGGVKDRFASIFNPNDAANRERLYVWTAGLKLVVDRPLLGVGQNSFPKAYPKYRDPNVLEPHISHLHNNMLQIAVERGIPCLLAWLAIWGIAYYHMGMAFRAGAFRAEAPRAPGATLGLVAGLGGITAFLVAGMFEYNFGDAEPQMLVLLLLALGMAGAQQESLIPDKGKTLPASSA